MMRRILAILVLLAFGLPGITPLLAPSGDMQSDLPACCRRNGKHHCTMQLEGRAASISSATSVAAPSPKCPFYPKGIPVSHQTPFVLDRSQAIYAGIVSHPTSIAQIEARRRISASRSNQKRGPPLVRLS